MNQRWKALEEKHPNQKRQVFRVFYGKRTRRGIQHADERYFVDVQAAAANFGPPAPVDSLIHAEAFAISEPGKRL